MANHTTTPRPFTTLAEGGYLRAGAQTPWGSVERTSMTAYLVVDEAGRGRWVPFTEMHEVEVITPLLRFA